MISKELLSTVLGIEVINFSHGGDFIEYSAVGILRDINIFELANKCKEWVYKKSIYHISSHIHGGGGYALVYQEYSEDCYFSCIATTEPEAIFKACEWVIKQ